MSKCPNSWFGKHKYQARYDEVARNTPLPHIKGELSESLVSEWMQLATLHKYVCDVCVHCGDKIVR